MSKDVINIAIDKQVAKQAKIQAAINGDTMKATIEKAIMEYLRKSKGKGDTNQDRRYNGADSGTGD